MEARKCLIVREKMIDISKKMYKICVYVLIFQKYAAITEFG